MILEAIIVCKWNYLYKTNELFLNVHGIYNVRMALVKLHGFNIYIKYVSKLVRDRK